MAYRETKTLYDQVDERFRHLHDKWMKDAQEIEKTYLGDKCDQTPFNILFSNTEILVPAIFARAPVPVVKRRFGESKADLPAKACERFLSYCMDTNLADYPTFVDAVEAAVLDAAVPGQGQARVRLVDGVPTVDYVHWDRFVWAYARRWEQVPWIAYAHDMTKDDLVRQFNLKPEKAAQLAELAPVDTDNEGKKTDSGRTENTYRVYEVWIKAERKVRFICDDYQDKVLKEEDDPLGLRGFFDCPKPLNFVNATGDLMPRPLYNLYKEQADELNKLTTRIKRLTNAIRIRGLFNGGIPELGDIFAEGAEDNTLIATAKPSVMTSDAGLDRHIWLIPVEKLIVVLRELLAAREAVKATIYEILGIGDILRGTSKASETLGAQQIKDRWGSLRINRARERMGRFLRELMRLMVEAGAKKTPEAQWAAMTGLKLPTAVEVQVLQASGQPPPPMSWPLLMQTLQSDLARSYTVDIETNSTVDSEATQDREDVTEFMTAVGQATAGLQALASSGPSGFNAAKTMLVEMAKRFRFGGEVQVVLEQLQPPPAAQGIPPEVQEQLSKAEEELMTREKEVEAQGEKVKQEQMKLGDAKLALQQQGLELKGMLQQIQAAQKELDFKQKTFTNEINTLAQSKMMELQSKGQEIDQKAVATDRAAVQGEVKMAQDKIAQASQIDGAVNTLAGAMEKLQAVMEQVQDMIGGMSAMQQQLSEQVARIPRKAKFIPQEDGSVLKEFIQ